MLQLSESKSRRPTQIAKRFKNGLPHLSRLFPSRITPEHTAPPIGIFRPPVLPWTPYDQPAQFKAYSTRAGKR